jgi:2,3-bisphosphoglycerate-dependent phosphoglycerate mutase
MELYFIRHGQSMNNAHWNNPDYTESPDPALTELGLEQACHLSEFLKGAQTIVDTKIWNIQNRFGFGLTHIYTSLMERAVCTAAPTARALGIPFSAWEEIHESGGIFGRDGEQKLQGLPGKSRSYFEEHFPELSLPEHLNGLGWWNNRPFETEEQCQERAQKFLADLLTLHADKDGEPEHRVAIFSHGAFFGHLIAAMLNMPSRRAAHGFNTWFSMNNCAISRFDFRATEVNIAYLNRTDHLPDRLITY